ncbi:hepatocellular carcinoma-associated antigen 59-domain-containing protein [Cytidiella melzeri]|nr:hepatocellular carcinoma-associated antigen 59-domain-containing protein [Cytidiella melzeri]
MFKKRSRPQPRVRQISPEETEDKEEVVEDTEEKIDIADLIELRKLRKAREGIDVAKLSKGEVKKKKKKLKDDEGEQGGLKPGASDSHDVEEEEEDADAKARRVVRANNFTQQTNTLDVDKHMMAYIEENMRRRRGDKEEETEDDGPLDPYAELFRVKEKLKKDGKPEKEEGNVTNSLAMLTAIPEVDLGMDARLKNIEDTEKAKRQVAEERKDRKRTADNEEHLTAARFYRPNLKMKSDADILRDAKLEAMGLPAESHEHRPHHERPQMATDELVMERFKKRMRK